MDGFLLAEPVLGSGVKSSSVPVTNAVVPCNSSEAVFRCDASTCIAKWNLCNGIPDCEDGQDESVAQCGE
jgi:hypothetical protein